MPWRESCCVDERLRFIADWLECEWTVVELCERYAVSRKTAYKWIERYRQEGPVGLAGRSSAPLRHGRATSDEVAGAILAQKAARPSWGPRKIVAWLGRRHPQMSWPAASTAGAILQRAGLVQPRRRRHRAAATLGGLTLAERPNHVWAADHKGWIRLKDGTRCEPLTVSDSFSRYLIGLSAETSTAGQAARPVFEQAFAEYGLPEVIRTDNGPPFAAAGVTGLTALSIWWARLGIRHERIQPGRPQQNGRHERFHLTLKEAMEPPVRNLAEQAVRFAGFRHDYNHERPHEALGQVPPAQLYQPSPRRLPRRLPTPDYPQGCDVRRVRSNGEIKWGGALIYVSSALIGELVAVQETDEGLCLVRFYDLTIGVIDTRQRRLRPAILAACGQDHTPPLSPTYPV